MWLFSRVFCSGLLCRCHTVLYCLCFSVSCLFNDACRPDCTVSNGTMTNCCQIDSRTKGPNCLLAYRMPRAPCFRSHSATRNQISICGPAVLAFPPPPPHTQNLILRSSTKLSPHIVVLITIGQPSRTLCLCPSREQLVKSRAIFYLTTVDCHFLSYCLLHQLSNSSDIPHARRSIGCKWQTLFWWYNKHPVYIQVPNIQISCGISWLTEDLWLSQEGPCSMT